MTGPTPWPSFVLEVVECECGEPIGVADHPARSYVDGRELGPLYLAADDAGRPFMRSLWRIGTGDAGAHDQRCPHCDRLLSKPAPVDDGQLALGV